MCVCGGVCVVVVVVVLYFVLSFSFLLTLLQENFHVLQKPTSWSIKTLSQFFCVLIPVLCSNPKHLWGDFVFFLLDN